MYEHTVNNLPKCKLVAAIYSGLNKYNSPLSTVTRGSHQFLFDAIQRAVTKPKFQDKEVDSNTAGRHSVKASLIERTVFSCSGIGKV